MTIPDDRPSVPVINNFIDARPSDRQFALQMAIELRDDFSFDDANEIVDMAIEFEHYLTTGKKLPS